MTDDVDSDFETEEKEPSSPQSPVRKVEVKGRKDPNEEIVRQEQIIDSKSSPSRCREDEPADAPAVDKLVLSASQETSTPGIPRLEMNRTVSDAGTCAYTVPSSWHAAEMGSRYRCVRLHTT